MKTGKVIDTARTYLVSRIIDGLCPEFHQLRHGPSLAWTSACVGSTLAEFGSIPKEMIEAILSLQWDCGGWSYNQKSVPDADSTLRVLQFLAKVRFDDKIIIDNAEKFVLSHQQVDGGITTYRPEMVAKMGYQEGGWTMSHPCVTALAVRVLRNEEARAKAKCYMLNRLRKGDARSYWWRTPWYVRYESSWIGRESISNDPVEISLVLLLKAKLGIADRKLMGELVAQQLCDGSFPASNQFRIPRPSQFLDDVIDEVEIVQDLNRIFSTSSALIAVSRQGALLN